MTVSPWFLTRREQYQAHLLSVSCTGDWNPWVQFFCQAVKEQCEALIQGADLLVRWLAESRRLLNERRWRGTVHRFLEDLIEWPVTTIADTAQRDGVTPVQASRMVRHLETVGILTELTGRNYGRVFGASSVMATVDAI